MCVALPAARRDGDGGVPGAPDRLPPRRAGLRDARRAGRSRSTGSADLGGLPSRARALRRFRGRVARRRDLHGRHRARPRARAHVTRARRSGELVACEIGGRVDVPERFRREPDDLRAELGDRVPERQVAGGETTLEHGERVLPVGARQRPALRDAPTGASVGASASVRQQRRASPRAGRSGGRRPARSARAAARRRRRRSAREPPSRRPPPGTAAARRPRPCRPRAGARTPRPSIRQARSASVSPSSSARAFGEPKRRLAPPTSRTPVTS